MGRRGFGDGTRVGAYGEGGHPGQGRDRHASVKGTSRRLTDGVLACWIRRSPVWEPCIFRRLFSGNVVPWCHILACERSKGHRATRRGEATGRRGGR